MSTLWLGNWLLAQWNLQGRGHQSLLSHQPPMWYFASHCFCFLRCIASSLLHEVLLLSCVSRVWLCATPYMAAHQAPPSLGFSRQEHWSGLPFHSPMHESEKWKWSRSVVSDSSQPHGLQPTRLLHPWEFPGKSTGVGCHCLLQARIKSSGSQSMVKYHLGTC